MGGRGQRGDRLRSQELVRRASRSRFSRSGASLLAVEDLCHEGVMPVGSRLTAKVRGPAGMFGFRVPAALCQ
jgi:hypothetical protein